MNLDLIVAQTTCVVMFCDLCAACKSRKTKREEMVVVEERDGFSEMRRGVCADRPRETRRP